MPVYRDYSQQELDAQYNCRGMVDDFEACIERWQSKSDRAVAEFDARLDLAYGDGPDERLDLFLPAGPGPFPVVVFIHGGYWRALDKTSHRFPALGLVPRGVAVATIDYSLAPKVRITKIVEQCRRAVAWVYRNAASFGVDPERVFVSGHSAGGHLTGMVLATDWPAFDPALPPDVVKGGAPISGLYDLEPIRLCYLNPDLHLDAAEAKAMSPLHHTPKGASRMVVITGGAESAEFHRQKAEFVRAWAAHGLPATVIDPPGKHHFTVVELLADRDSEATQAIASLALTTR